VCPACLRKPTAFIAEYFCRDCRTPFQNRFPLDEDGRCSLCRLGLNGFDAAYCFGAFEAELRELIHVFKYGRVQTLAGPLGRFLALALPRAEEFDVVVPMPLYWTRRWTRGFNQSELLAREIARRASVPVRKVVRRAKPTTPQAGLTNAKRRANVRGAFQVRRPERVAGLRILLVDDVMTTGATASSCARELKRAGAARVTLLTVARVDRRMSSDAERLSVMEPEQDHVGSAGDHARA
jgi:ComF family protein